MKNIALAQNRVDIMVDLETLGTKNDALIFQISTISFDINTGEMYEGVYNARLDLDDDPLPMKGVYGNTLSWWLKDGRSELLAKILNDNTIDRGNSYSILMGFNLWVKEIQNLMGKKDVYLWGNGMLFDNAKLQKNLEDNDIDYPIHYQNDRDMRTYMELAMYISGYTKQEIQDEVMQDIIEEGKTIVEHDAIDDCYFQIRCLHWCKKVITNINLK